MNVLLLTQILPYPPNAGPRVKTWHVLKDMLAREFDVTLVSFIRDDEQEYLPFLESKCQHVITIPIRRSRWKDVCTWIRSIITRRPFLIERDGSLEMRSTTKALLQQNTFDIIYADQITMTQFVPKKKEGKQGPYRVFDAHNATWVIIERMREGLNRWVRPVLTTEMRRIKQYEGEIIREFEHILTVTEIDRMALLDAANYRNEVVKTGFGNISVVPITIDTDDLVPTHRRPNSNNILTLGTLHYKPNADGILWFLREVFPIIHKDLSDVRLTIIGKKPPHELQELANEWPDSVKVTGYVRDLTPYFEQSALIIVPVLAGSGMRVRILEAFARGMPVVTTTIGLEGIDAHPGMDVMIADSPPIFASSVIRVLKDTQLQDELAKNGRQLVKMRYDWRIALRAMDIVYSTAEEHGNVHFS